VIDEQRFKQCAAAAAQPCTNLLNTTYKHCMCGDQAGHATGSNL
jgi:hypothetical protein